MTDVFISYKREDRLKARAIAEALAKTGLDVWWDIELLPGQKFADEINAVIDRAKAAVVLWTPTSVQSHWVLSEAAHALDRNILVPVWIERVELPVPYNTVQTLDLTTWSGATTDPLLDDLIAGVQQVTGQLEKSTSTRTQSEIEAVLSKPAHEVEFWTSITKREPQSIHEYQLYLKKYGLNGTFTDLAELRIQDLSITNGKHRLPSFTTSLTILGILIGIIAGTLQIKAFVWTNDQEDKKSNSTEQTETPNSLLASCRSGIFSDCGELAHLYESEGELANSPLFSGKYCSVYSAVNDCYQSKGECIRKRDPDHLDCDGPFDVLYCHTFRDSDRTSGEWCYTSKDYCESSRNDGDRVTASPCFPVALVGNNETSVAINLPFEEAAAWLNKQIQKGEEILRLEDKEIAERAMKWMFEIRFGLETQAVLLQLNKYKYSNRLVNELWPRDAETSFINTVEASDARNMVVHSIIYLRSVKSEFSNMAHDLAPGDASTKRSSARSEADSWFKTTIEAGEGLLELRNKDIADKAMAWMFECRFGLEAQSVSLQLDRYRYSNSLVNQLWPRDDNGRFVDKAEEADAKNMIERTIIFLKSIRVEISQIPY